MHSHREAFAAHPEARPMGKGRDLYVVRKRRNPELPVEIGLNPILTSEGSMILSAIIDISERKKAIAALAERREELQRSNADLEQFAYVASHDLQEPLRMVASYTELLAEHYRGKLDEKAEKYIRYARGRRQAHAANWSRSCSPIPASDSQGKDADTDQIRDRGARTCSPV